jgi:hypothetical protein
LLAESRPKQGGFLFAVAAPFWRKTAVADFSTRLTHTGARL